VLRDWTAALHEMHPDHPNDMVRGAVGRSLSWFESSLGGVEDFQHGHAPGPLRLAPPGHRVC
jgi:hypothetical protein